MDFDTLIVPAPFVEVELVYEQGRPGLSGAGYCALQLWTQNHVYDLDWSMRCFRVSAAGTGEPIPDHKLLGTRLTGGQKQEKGGIELTYPVPRPGTVAVFEIAGQPRPEYITTSEVSRVVLRLRVISVPEEQQAAPVWDDLSGSFRYPVMIGDE